MIQQTTDVEFIRRIVTHPSVWPHAVEEGLDPQTWFPPMHGVAWLCIPGVDAVALVYRVCGRIYAYDAAMLPHARAPVISYETRRSYIELIKAWLRENTDCVHLVAFIAEDNARSLRAAEADGLALEGRIPKSKKRGDKFIDALIFGTGV